MQRPSLHQAKDTAFAIVLVLLIASRFWREYDALITAAIAVLLLAMIVPRAFSPAATVWFGVSKVLGSVVSKVILAAIHLLIATPIGLVRRLLGADSMRLKAWKADSSSVFVVRDHRVAGTDLETPY